MQILDKSKTEKQLTDVLVSPCRLTVLNNLAGSDGLSLEDMKKQMTVHTINLDKHIKKLVADSIIHSMGGKYSLTRDGKNLYVLLQQVAQKIKTD